MISQQKVNMQSMINDYIITISYRQSGKNRLCLGSDTLNAHPWPKEKPLIT